MLFSLWHLQALIEGGAGRRGGGGDAVQEEMLQFVMVEEVGNTKV